MFENVKDFLTQNAPLKVDQAGEPSSLELQTAVVALLHGTSEANGVVTAEEKDSILRAIPIALGVEDAEAADLIEMCAVLHASPERMEKFIAAVDQNFSTDQKLRLLSLVWQVLSADGEADKLETAYATELRKKLGLSMEQAVLARQMCQRSLAERATAKGRRDTSEE